MARRLPSAAITRTLASNNPKVSSCPQLRLRFDNLPGRKLSRALHIVIAVASTSSYEPLSALRARDLFPAPDLTSMNIDHLGAFPVCRVCDSWWSPRDRPMAADCEHIFIAGAGGLLCLHPCVH